MSIEAMTQMVEALKRGRPQIIGVLVQQDQDQAIKAGLQAIAEAEKQEPVAWMDVYRNIYSLEEKAAGCPEAIIPLVPLANQQKTSGSPIFQRWAVFCVGCRKEWSVPYQHPGKSICTDCETKLTGGAA